MRGISAVSHAFLTAVSDRTCTVRSCSDTTGFARPVGTPATITATVSCLVRLSDLAMPGLGGSRTVTATASSPLDTYRER